MTKTYAQIAREIAALQATASKLYAIEVKSAVEKVNELIAKYGLSVDDLKFGSAPAASQPMASASAAKSAKATPAAAASGAKYSDGQGRFWGGRGPRPAWLRSAIAAGRSLESFLAAGAADVVAALTKSVSGPAKKSAAKKPVATGAAKYVNPKTGAGWSGRGPRPQWLKDALKKRGSKIEDFLGNKPASTDAVVAAPAAPVPAPAPVKKVMAKKAAAPAEKVAAKKTVAKKTAAKKVTAVAAPAAPAKKAAAKKAPVKAASKKAVKAPAKTAAKTAAVAPAKKATVSKVASKKAPAKKVSVSSAVSAAPVAAAPAGDTAAPLASV